MAKVALGEEISFELVLSLSAQECRILKGWVQNPIGQDEDSEQMAEAELRKVIFNALSRSENI